MGEFYTQQTKSGLNMPALSEEEIFSLDAGQLAARYQLGALLSEHPARRKTKGQKIAFVLLPFCSLLLLAFTALIAWIAVSNIQQLLSYVSNSFISLLILLAVLIAFCCLWVVILSIPIFMYRNRRPLVLVGSEGLLYRRGGRISVVRWDEIAQVRQRIFQSTFSSEKTPLYSCRLHLNDGKKYRFNNNVQHMARLGRAIQREVAKRRVPELLAAYEQGETLTFGSLRISKTGLQKGKALLSWERTTALRVRKGIVTIERDGEPINWPLTPISRIPNFFAFIGLLYYILDGRITYPPAEEKTAPGDNTENREQ